MTKTANRKTVATTVGSPIPSTPMRMGTSAEMGALTKTLTQVPSVLATGFTRAISTPSVRPTTSASAIPMANERREISTALMNFSLGRMVKAATMTRESGGKMLEKPNRPTSSHTRAQTRRETPRGILLPNSFIACSAQPKYFFKTCQI